MRKFKKTMAWVLSLAMVVTMIPAFTVMSSANNSIEPQGSVVVCDGTSTDVKYTVHCDNPTSASSLSVDFYDDHPCLVQVDSSEFLTSCVFTQTDENGCEFILTITNKDEITECITLYFFKINDSEGGNDFDKLVQEYQIIHPPYLNAEPGPMVYGDGGTVDFRLNILNISDISENAMVFKENSESDYSQTSPYFSFVYDDLNNSGTVTVDETTPAGTYNMKFRIVFGINGVDTAFSQTVDIVVSPSPIKISFNDSNMEAGGSEPADYTFTYDENYGLKNNDAAADVFTTAPIGKLADSADTSKAGEYDIVLGNTPVFNTSGAGNNYSFDPDTGVTNGTLTVTEPQVEPEKEKTDFTGVLAAGILVQTLKSWFSPILNLFFPQRSIFNLFGNSFFGRTGLFSWFW